MNQRLVHDATFLVSTHLLEIVSPALPSEEQKDVFAEFYRVVRAGIESFAQMHERLEQRLYVQIAKVSQTQCPSPKGDSDDHAENHHRVPNPGR